MPLFFKKSLLLMTVILCSLITLAQDKPAAPPVPPNAGPAATPPKPGPKPYKDVITDNGQNQ